MLRTTQHFWKKSWCALDKLLSFLSSQVSSLSFGLPDRRELRRKELRTSRALLECLQWLLPLLPEIGSTRRHRTFWLWVLCPFFKNISCVFVARLTVRTSRTLNIRLLCQDLRKPWLRPGAPVAHRRDYPSCCVLDLSRRYKLP